MNAVLSYGEVRVDDPGRIAAVKAPGLDEVLFVRRGPRHHQEFSTIIADDRGRQLLDIRARSRGQGTDRPVEEPGEQWQCPHRRRIAQETSQSSPGPLRPSERLSGHQAPLVTTKPPTWVYMFLKEPLVSNQPFDQLQAILDQRSQGVERLRRRFLMSQLGRVRQNWQPCRLICQGKIA